MALPRDVTPAECSFANGRWVTRFERGTPPEPAPVNLTDTPPCPSARGCSPIVLDLDGLGITLSPLSSGVVFDIDSDAYPDFISWMDVSHVQPFLWLDRNGDGVVDGGAELFGDSSPQPPSNSANGFVALSVFDSPPAGGNGDGIISSSDAVYTQLRLWFDCCPRDGTAQKSEVATLDELGVAWIGLDYRDLRIFDEYGNVFRWHGRFGRVEGKEGDAIDVLFVGGPVPLPEPQ